MFIFFFFKFFLSCKYNICESSILPFKILSSVSGDESRFETNPSNWLLIRISDFLNEQVNVIVPMWLFCMFEGQVFLFLFWFGNKKTGKNDYSYLLFDWRMLVVNFSPNCRLYKIGEHSYLGVNSSSKSIFYALCSSTFERHSVHVDAWYFFVYTWLMDHCLDNDERMNRVKIRSLEIIIRGEKFLIT